MSSITFPALAGTIVDYRSTEAEFHHILSLGKDEHGQPLSLDKLDHGIKDSRKLLREMHENAVILHHNPETGRVERRAKSIRVRLFELRRRIIWLEIARSYPDGQITRSKKKSSLSEMLKRKDDGTLESRDETWGRIKREEIPKVVEQLHGAKASFDLVPQIIMPDDWLRAHRLLPSHLVPEPAVEEWRTETHESSVFAGLPSIIDFLTYDVYLDLESPEGTLGSEILITKDCDGREEDDPDWVKCYLKAFPDTEAGT